MYGSLCSFVNPEASIMRVPTAHSRAHRRMLATHAQGFRARAPARHGRSARRAAAAVQPAESIKGMPELLDGLKFNDAGLIAVIVQVLVLMLLYGTRCAPAQAFRPHNSHTSKAMLYTTRRTAA